MSDEVSGILRPCPSYHHTFHASYLLWTRMTDIPLAVSMINYTLRCLQNSKECHSDYYSCDDYGQDVKDNCYFRLLMTPSIFTCNNIHNHCYH